MRTTSVITRAAFSLSRQSDVPSIARRWLYGHSFPRAALHRITQLHSSSSSMIFETTKSKFLIPYDLRDPCNNGHPLRRSVVRLSFFSTSNSSSSHQDDDDDKAMNQTKSAAPTAVRADIHDPSAQKKTNTSRLRPTATVVLPGVVLSAATALSGFSLAATISAMTDVPLSGIPVAILLGMAVRTAVLPTHSVIYTTLQPGLTFAAKTILQGGIVCVGIKLSVWQLLSASTTCVPVVLAAVTAGMVGIPRIATLLKLDNDSKSSLVPLITAGTSICGVTAISALAPAIRAPPADVAVAVANTVMFGTIGMLFYPYLLHSLIVGVDGGASSVADLQHGTTVVGLTLGVAIHDTSQVLGAALSYKETYGDAAAMELAAVTKLVRNLGLAAAIPYLTYQHHKNQSTSSTPDAAAAAVSDMNSEPIRAETLSGLPTFTSIVPPFLVAFLAMSVLRSVCDVTLGTATYDTAELYHTVVNVIGNDLSKYALGTAMAATGLSIDARSLRHVGWRPFALGGLSAVLVGSVGCYTAHAVSYINAVPASI
jgi:uncharacterized membrane protein YadS